MKLKINPDTLVGKPYDKETFNCYDFLCECTDMPSLNGIAVDAAIDNVNEYKPFFIERLEPVDYCIVILGDSHLGIVYGNGAYHADKDMVKYESFRVLRRKYNKLEFYDKADT